MRYGMQGCWGGVEKVLFISSRRRVFLVFIREVILRYGRNGRQTFFFIYCCVRGRYFFIMDQGLRKGIVTLIFFCWGVSLRLIQGLELYLVLFLGNMGLFFQILVKIGRMGWKFFVLSFCYKIMFKGFFCCKILNFYLVKEKKLVIDGDEVT